MLTSSALSASGLPASVPSALPSSLIPMPGGSGAASTPSVPPPATSSVPLASSSLLPVPDAGVGGSGESIVPPNFDASTATDVTGSPADPTTSDVTPSPSTSAEPDVPLPDGLTGMFPLPSSTDLCPDPTLHLHFAGTPSLGSSGKVSVFDSSEPGSPVASVDLSQSTLSDTFGGANFNVPRAAYVDGNEVIFTLPAQGLGYGRTFYVTVDPGVVSISGQDFAIEDPETWRFTTAGSAPTDDSSLRVSLDGAGQFCTVQSAIDAAADGATISIGAGNYYGVVYFRDRGGLVLRGDDRELTAIKGVNNNNLNPSTRGRALVGTENVSDLVIENLSIENLTPQGGSQAEALALLGCHRCLIRDVNIESLQDTLLWQGTVYADNCYIAGNVDYVWGTGAVYFNDCEIRTVGRKGYIVQSRNGADKHGYVFVNSRLTSDPGISGDVLARIDVSKYPSSEVAYIDCEIGPHIAEEGWLISGGSAPQSLRFVEYGNYDPAGEPIDTSKRLAGSRRLSAEEAEQYRDPSWVLEGWTPPER